MTVQMKLCALFLGATPVRLLATLAAGTLLPACEMPKPIDANTLPLDPNEVAPKNDGQSPAPGATAAPTLDPPAPPQAAAPAGGNMTTEDLRTELAACITKAKLSGSKKKHFRSLLPLIPDENVEAARSDLTQLFQKTRPKEIAAGLKRLDLFKSTHGKAKKNGSKGSHKARQKDSTGSSADAPI